MRKILTITAIVGGAVVIVAAAAIAASPAEVAGRPTGHGADPVEVVNTTEAPTPTVEPLDLNDFAATLKVTDKQCFGSAGCNVTVEPSLDYVHAADTLDNRTYSITLTITGDESGPVITTIDGTGQSYNVMPVVLSPAGRVWCRRPR